MSSILYNIIIAPIELVVEIVFELLFRLVGHNYGIAVIGVSVAISLLMLPLYRRADAVQQKERDTQKRLAYRVNRIKKAFKSDERFMMLQAYYRENGYSPLYALCGSFSLLLQIPFFIAAYHFLSHLEVLRFASFGFIRDLGAPDGLAWGGVNILPVLMTAINCVSAAVYLRGFPLRDKVQTYGMALIFLVLLYNSPSALVLYWTCNNIFSLAKNIFYKLRNPRKVAVILCTALGTLLTLALFMSGVLNSRKKYAAVLLFECVALLPLILRLIKNTAIAGRVKIFFGKLLDGGKDEAFPISTFWLSGIFLTLLLGILIPAAVISASPHEFVDVTTYKNPLGVILYSTCYAAGFFLLWSGIICFMLNAKARNILCLILWILGGIFLTDYLFFGTRLGLISPLLEFDEGVRFLPKEKLLNLFCTTILTVGMFSLFRFKKVVKFVYAVLLISITGLSMLNIARAQKEFSQMVQLKNKETYHNGKSLIKLSRKNKNIIVLMIDRLPGGYIPYFFEQRPELEKQFKGFTFYPNTLSFGRYTNLCTPSLFGGYEYTPAAINARQDNTPLSRKHDEAIKVLPKIFSDEGYDVSVADIPYAGYKGYPDLSVYDEYPSVQKLYLQGMFSSKYRSYVSASSGSPHADGRTFFMYSLFKVFPVYISKFVYDNGAYWNPWNIGMTYCWTSEFIDSFSALKELPTITDTTDDSNGVFLMMATNAAHSATGRVFLHSPNFDIPYKKSEISDDMHEAIPETDGIRFDDKTLPTYHTGMATFVQLGIWFDWMRKNGVYDNTRIILVSDHGSSPSEPGLTGYAPFESMLLQNPKVDVSSVNPMLMVKDFGNVEFNTDISFMTNADVPSIALKDIVSEPVNPFTNKTISTEEKVLSPCMVTSSVLIDIKEHKGNGFTENGRWYSVHDNIFKEENWTLVE